jgi:site-specific recombinase XerD
MKNKKDVSKDSSIFWKMAKDYIDHRLPDIRKVSPNTIIAYRSSLNKYIDYMESVKGVSRADMCFSYFSSVNLTEYLDWMLNDKKLSAKTCNLRITAIHALLEYAANENSTDLMALYLESKRVRELKISAKPIEYFEGYQMKALLAVPDIRTRTGQRDQMMLILYYDTAARISELLEMTLDQLHLNADIPYLTIFGKGCKYRNIPLTDKTVEHLKKYLGTFHEELSTDSPLFYARTYGEIHHLSHDTVETMIKKYCKACTVQGISMPEKPHCHMIRKTRAMDLYKSGMPLAHIQQLLGHESMSTTSGFYAFATIETLSRSMAVANREETGNGKKWDNQVILNKIYAL